MNRPLAKYCLVATDVAQYEAEREEKQLPPLDELSITVVYNSYMPCAYNIAEGQPNDSKMGYRYTYAFSGQDVYKRQVHILPHWNWENRIGEITPVYVYTSGDTVELFLNGKSLGRKEKSHAYDRLRWMDVRYEPGVLKAVAYKNGKRWAEGTIETTGKPARIQVTPEKNALKADGSDLSFIRVRCV